MAKYLKTLAPLQHEEPVYAPLYTEYPEPFNRLAFVKGCLWGLLFGACIWVLVFGILWRW